MKIGDEVYIHGYIDEIRKDTVIIRNEGGYFGTVQEEISVKPQESRGDAIRKQAVLDIFGDVADYWKEHAIDVEPHEFKDAIVEQYEYTAKQLSKLPPVTPQPKTGHWEWVQYDYNPRLGNWHCSECRCVVVECVDKNEKGGIPLYKYCPQCGAKMER